MLRYQQQFTFFDIARVNESVRYLNLSQDVVDDTLKKLLERIVQEVEATSPGVVIVDSFRTAGQGRRIGPRTVTSTCSISCRLAVRLTGWQATTFLSAVSPPFAADTRRQETSSPASP